MKKKQAKKIIKELSAIAYWLMKLEQKDKKPVEFRRFVPLPEIKPLEEMEEKDGSE